MKSETMLTFTARALVILAIPSFAEAGELGSSGERTRHGWNAQLDPDGRLTDIWSGDQIFFDSDGDGNPNAGVSINDYEDWKYGVYGAESQEIDALHYDSPKLLQVCPSGSENQDIRRFLGLAFVEVRGTRFEWYRTFYSGGDIQSFSTPRPPSNVDANGGYDTMTWDRTAKNALYVGSIDSNFLVFSFSSRGPIDDGRLAPFVVALDEDAPIATTPNSETSLASLAVTASADLITQRYSDLHPNRQSPRSSLLKAVIGQTAIDLGIPNMDYIYGLGRMDMEAAINLVNSDAATESKSHLKELLLTSGENIEFTVTAQGGELPLSAAICWTDPEGNGVSVDPAISFLDNPGVALDATTPSLVNDLDIRIIDPATMETFQPWTLDPANPSAAAAIGDNTVDNFEKVSVFTPVAGKEYLIRVTHKRNLLDDQAAIDAQEISIVITGNNVLPKPRFQALIDEMTPGVYTLTWQSVVGNRYQVQQSPDLSSWTNSGGEIWANRDTMSISITPLPTAEKTFYRVQELDGFSN